MKFLLALTCSLILHVLIFSQQEGFSSPLSFIRPIQETPAFLEVSLISSPNLQTSGRSKKLEQTSTAAVTQSVTKPEQTISVPHPFLFDIYHYRHELTQAPQVIEDVDLSPLVLLDNRPSGELVVELYINEFGTIDQISIDPNQPPVFEELRELLLKLKFSSGEIDGKIVKTRLKIGVVFPPKQQGE